MLTRCTCGVEKCVPVMSSAFDSRDEVLRDVVVGHRHVGAVLAQEDQRERVAVLDPEHDGAGEPRGIDADVRDVAAFARQRLDQEAAHRVVADARGHRRLEAEPRAAECGVGRRAAEILGEARDVLEPRADLLRVEVDGEAAEADDVERRPEAKRVLFFMDGKCGPRRCGSSSRGFPVT